MKTSLVIVSLLSLGAIACGSELPSETAIFPQGNETASNILSLSDHAQGLQISPEQEAFLERYGNSVVKVETAQGSGTGFFLTEDGWIATNRHVVGAFESVTIRLPDGSSARGSVEYVAPSLMPGDPTRGATFNTVINDIALIKIEPSIEPFDPVAIAQFNENAGIRVTAIGSSVRPDLYGEKDFLLTDGVLTTNIILVSPDMIRQGFSGGPLFNEDGQAIGMNTFIFSIDPNNPRCDGDTYDHCLGGVIPIESIVAAANRLGVTVE